MSNLEFFQFECLSDNFGVLVHDPASSNTAAIDVPEENALFDALKEKGWNLTHVLVTHHHYDHVQGIPAAKEKYGCHVIGPAMSADKIPTLDETIQDGDSFEFGGDKVNVIATPGHTLDMVNFHFVESNTLFTGDTLFALGCGRIFEGDPEMMWNSLDRLRQLPPQTTIYCGHEYTLGNAQFSLTVDPENDALISRLKEIEALRAQGKPTLPTTIALELETNPFLRADDLAIRKYLGMDKASNAEVFAEIRKRKDNA